MPNLNVEQVKDLMSKEWHYLFVPDGDGFSAKVVELDGCFAEGNSFNEALTNLQTAMEDWFAITLEQGNSIPKPIPLDSDEPIIIY